jgi:2-polyprenyl-3-methyl-5-hydroxy-6-metoxy-1,4-benzoquinol methylase
MSYDRSCPVCKTSSKDAALFQKENIDENRISGFSYASRKEPEFMCHRLVRCKICDLVYVSNPPEEQHLANAYHVSEYDSSEEADDAASAYIKTIQPILENLETKKKVLEIGSGTGVFLELLKNHGFIELIGIEPSSAAIEAAPRHRHAWLRKEIFKEQNFNPASFDLICCFMTMEHVYDPLIIAQAAQRLLKPNGAFVTVTHDYTSLINRLLGKKSPIIDIEHMQLFSKKSICELFQRSDFNKIYSKPFINQYSFNYWLRLAPLPSVIKKQINWLSSLIGIGKIKIGLNVGNRITAGYKL